jgi:cyanophycinase
MMRKIAQNLSVCVLFTLTLSVFAQTSGPAHGALFIHGGGGLSIKEFIQLSKRISGKEAPRFLVISTAQGKNRLRDFTKSRKMVAKINRLVDQEVATELFTLDREFADSDELVAKIDAVDAIFMGGGNQCYLTDTFLGTRGLEAMHRLLERGGVIGGSSAGAQVQSSFMTRGDYKKRQILGDKKHQEGFAFLANAALDVHVGGRKRETDLLQVFSAKKRQLQNKNLDTQDLLGIGIDQGTAITVIGDTLTVSGSGKVYIFNPKLWDTPKSAFYINLSDGQSYDLKQRTLVP